MERIRASGVREGIVSLWSMHTTCALFINEAQKALHADIKRVLEQVVDRDAEWMHNDPQHSDCDRMNADAHLRAHAARPQPDAAGQRRASSCSASGSACSSAELDGPRARSVRLQVMGVA